MDQLQTSLLEEHGFTVLAKLDNVMKDGTGLVFKVFKKEYGVIMANVMNSDKFDRQKWLTHLELSKKKENPFILKFISADIYGTSVVILSEFANMMNINKLIEAKNELQITTIRAIMRQLLESLRWINENGMIYNLLLHNPPCSERVVLKIANFNFATEQILSQQSSDQSSTIFDAGILFYQLVTHEYPFKDQSEQELINSAQVLQRHNSITDDHLWDLLQKMLKFNPNDRISAADALKHQFFANEETINKIQQEFLYLAQQSQELQKKGDQSITQYDLNALFIIPLSDIKFNIIIDYDKVAEILKIPVIGNDFQKEQIQLKKENECQNIILKLKCKSDDEGRTSAINAGVTQELINIIETCNMNITPVYVETFNVLSLASSKTRVMIQQKNNPYPSLLRLLDSQNNEVINHSINSICSILRGGLLTTAQGYPHPNFELIESFDGINKIFSLFKQTSDKKIKDTAAICLGRLFRAKEITDQNMRVQLISHFKSLLNDPDEWTQSESFNALGYIGMKTVANRFEIIQGIELNTIIEELKKPIVGNDEQKKEMYQQQQIQCFFLSKLLQYKNDTQFRRSAIKQGLVQIFLSIFESQDITSITRKTTDAFFELTIIEHRKVKDLLYPKWKPFPGLIRLLDNTDNAVITDILCSMHIILQQDLLSGHENEPHPYFEMIQSCGGIEKLFNVHKKSDHDKYNQDYSAMCICLICRGREIPDQDMKTGIVSHLIKIVTNPDDPQNSCAFTAMNILSWNSGNLSEILKRVEMSSISEDLKKSLIGNEEEMKQIIKQQEGQCYLLNSLIKGRKDDNLREIIIKSGITKSLINIFENRDLSQITQQYIDTFYQITEANKEVNSLLFSFNPYPSLLRLLTHTNNEISHLSIKSIKNILESTSPASLQSQYPHPHYNYFVSIDGIEKIISYIRGQNISNESREISAVCILHLCQENEVPNTSIKIKQKSLNISNIDLTNNQLRNSQRINLPHLEQNSGNSSKVDKYIICAMN